MTEVDWSRMGYRSWSDLAVVRARLRAGADPNTLIRRRGRPLHYAAREGSAEVVAELARLVDDVDAVDSGRTALWLAVHAGKPANARALVAAGADPERPMMGGWSPARLSRAGATPDLFDTSATLTDAEAAAVAEARRLIDALAGINGDGRASRCTTVSSPAGTCIRAADGPRPTHPPPRSCAISCTSTAPSSTAARTPECAPPTLARSPSPTGGCGCPNMMRREKAFWWQDRHHEIRACRARETGMWLASADVTGERDGTHLGLGPTGFLDPTGEVVGQVPAGVPGMATADISPPTRSNNTNDA